MDALCVFPMQKDNPMKPLNKLTDQPMTYLLSGMILGTILGLLITWAMW